MTAPRPPRFRAVGHGNNLVSGEGSETLVNQNWLIRFAPQTFDDVAMHRRKRLELKSALSVPNLKLLVVSGPPGSSKTAAIRMLCKDFGRNIVEWSSPSSNDGVGFVNAFGDFCIGAALLSKRDVVLVDEPPNLAHLDTRAAFLQTLKWWLSEDVPLLILVMSDDSAHESRIDYLLRGLLDRIEVRHVRTNPVNSTEIKRLLRRILVEVKGETRDRKNKNFNAAEKVISELAESGDVRFAVTSFELWFRSGEGSVPHARDGAPSVFQALHVALGGKSDLGRIEEYLLEAPEDSAKLNLHLLQSYTSKLEEPDNFAAAAEWLSVADVRQPWLKDDMFPSCLGAFGVSVEIQDCEPIKGVLQFAQTRGHEIAKADYRETLYLMQSDAAAYGIALSESDASLQRAILGATSQVENADLDIDFSDSDSDW